MDPKTAFPATFYPGTSDGMLATVVEIGAGERHELEPMLLPPVRQTYRLTGIVTFADGTPVPAASISLADGDAPSRQVAVGIRTGADGRFSFVVQEGLSYVARVSYTNPNDPEHKQQATRVGPFIISAETAPLTVVLPPAR